MVKVGILGSSDPIRIVEAGLLRNIITQVMGSDTLEGYTVRVNGGGVATLDVPVQEGSLVTIVPEVKAG